MLTTRSQGSFFGQFIVGGCVTLAVLCIPHSAFAASILTADLASFAVLGAGGVTNVATSTIGGNLGSAPNASLDTGYVFTSGGLQPNTALAAQAQIDLDFAILAVNAFGPGDLLGSDLTGTIFPGTYTVPAAATNLTGTLILDGNGSNTAVWAFLFPSTLITSTTSNVIVQNVGDGAGVGIYWSVGSAATLNGNTFAGNVLAQTLISSDGNLTLSCGRLLSATSQVTLIQDTVSTGCEGVGRGSDGFDQAGDVNAVPVVVPVPEPASLILFASGLLAVARRRLPRNPAARP